MADYPDRIFQRCPKAQRCGGEHADGASPSAPGFGSAAGAVFARAEIEESPRNDYRFRAVAPRAEVAAALADMVARLDYSNFKSEITKVQGHKRAHLYHEV